MSKMWFDDMNWYGNMHKGLDAIRKIQENKGLGAIMAMSKTPSYEKGLGAIIAMSKTPAYEKGLGAIMALAQTNTYEKNFKGLRSISEDLYAYKKVKSGLDKIVKMNTGMALHHAAAKNPFYDVMQKQKGLLAGITPPIPKTFTDMFKDMNIGMPKTHMTLMEALAKVNMGIPNSLHNTAFNVFQKQDTLFGLIRKQPWEMNSHAFAQAAILSQHAGIVSKSFLSDIIINQEWGELEESERTIDKITELVNDFFTQKIDVNQFLKSTVEFLSVISAISSTEKAKNIREKITYFLTIIGFIMTVVALWMTLNPAATAVSPAMSSKMEQDLDTFRRATLKKLDALTPSSYGQRIAKTKTALRFSPFNKSKILTDIKEWQVVRVIEIRHKWLFITFTDEKKEQIHSGWVMKKYFEEF